MKVISIQSVIYIQEYNFSSNKCNDLSAGSTSHYIGRLKRGRARLVSGDITLELREGDMFYIPKGCKYRSYWIAGEEGVVFDSFAFSQFPCVNGRRSALQKLECSKNILDLADAIAFERNLHKNSLRVSALLLTLLSEILPTLMEAKAAGRNEQLVQKVLSAMRDDPTADIPAIAAACAVSESAVYAAFRDSGYNTPNEERQKILIAKAVSILTSTDEPIEKISADLGFSSSAYFRKIFRKITGTSPRKIRQEATI